MTRISKSTPFKLINHAITLQTKNWSAILKIFRNGWWRRVWVIQEAALARIACIACGHERMKWSDIIFVAIHISLVDVRMSKLWCKRDPNIWDEVDLLGTRPFISEVTAKTLAHTSTSLGRNNTLDLFEFFRFKCVATFPGLEVSDTRDHIYGLLALINESDRRHITVRYDDSLTDKMLYMKTTEVTIRRTCPQVLYYACGMTQKPNDMPSWVLTWAIIWEGLPPFRFRGICASSNLCFQQADIRADVEAGIL
jgi:hypothetical protein